MRVEEDGRGNQSVIIFELKEDRLVNDAVGGWNFFSFEIKVRSRMKIIIINVSSSRSSFN